jgi:phosphatidylinositol alpha-1,6-mannosyltransferase
MRILIVALDFPPARGGILEWTFQVALHLSHRHDVQALVAQPDEAGPFDHSLPFPVVRYRTWASTDKTLLPLSGLLLKYCRPAPDMVLFTHLLAAAGAYPLLQRLGVPYAVVAHGQELHVPDLQQLFGATIQASCACIANSQSTADVLVSQGIPVARITVIPPGVPATLLESRVTPQAATWLRRLAPPAVPVMLTVARLDKRRKGHDMLLQALPLIVAQVPQVLYIIAGDGRQRHNYEALATSLAIGTHVLFTGHIDDDQRDALYDRCDAFAMISREERDGDREGFGIVFLEAAARGKPAIGGRSGGVPDAVIDGVTGLLVDPLNPEAIAAACVKVLLDHDLATRLGEAGRARIRAAFTWDTIVRRIEDLLQQSL